MAHWAVLSPPAESSLAVSPASSVSALQSLSACSPLSFPRRWGFQGVRTPLGPRRRGTPASPPSEGQSCGPGSSFPFDSLGGSSFSPRQGRRQEAPRHLIPGVPQDSLARSCRAGRCRDVRPRQPGGLGGWWCPILIRFSSSRLNRGFPGGEFQPTAPEPPLAFRRALDALGPWVLLTLPLCRLLACLQSLRSLRTSALRSLSLKRQVPWADSGHHCILSACIALSS